MITSTGMDQRSLLLSMWMLTPSSEALQMARDSQRDHRGVGQSYEAYTETFLLSILLDTVLVLYTVT